MAVLISSATGNFTAAGTWKLVDATSYLNSEAGSEVLTTAYSGTRTAAFTPGAITIDAIAVKISVRTGTTGTISVNLEKDSDDSQVAGTEVTLNVSDLPAAVTADLNGGWVVFAFAAPVLLLAATAYQVAGKTSSATQVSLFRDGTTDNFSRALRTTTNQAPGAADDLIVAGEHTGAGTGNSFVVTQDQTAATDYGSAPTAANSLITPGLSVCKRGTISWKDTSAANPLLRMSNSIIVYAEGTLNIGTTGTPIPRDSVAVLEFDCAADGDYGLIARNLSTLNIQGLSRTSGKNIVKCLLNTDEAIGQTTLGVDTDTGWLSGDQVAIASTTRTAAECETGTLNGNAGASSIVVTNMIVAAAGNAVPPAGGAALLAAHSGTSPTQAEVILLTRNAKVRSISATLMAYVNIKATATVDIDWAEFYFLGEAVVGKRGIEVETTTGAFNMQYSSIHDCEDNGLYLTGSALNNVTYSHNTMWLLGSIVGPGCQIATTATGTSITIDDDVLIRTLNGNGWIFTDIGGTLTNITSVGTASVGIQLNESNDVGVISNLTGHACTSGGIQFAGYPRGTISTLTVWRNNSTGLIVTGSGGMIVDGVVTFGNANFNISYATAGPDVTIKNAAVNGDTTFGTGIGLITPGTGGGFIRLVDCDFGTVSGIKTAHTTADINISAGQTGYILAYNTKLASATEVGLQTNLVSDAHVSLQRLDNTAGNHKTHMRTGTIQTDSTIFNTASPSARMTPNNASLKLQSAPRGKAFLLPVASGATVSVAVYIYKSASGDGAAYNGNQPRLIQRSNPAGGVDADVVLAAYTAGTGSWNQISGTTTALSDDGSIEIIVDCDGTAGWINVEDLSRDGTVVATMKYWSDGLPDIDPPAAAGSVTPLGSGLHPIEMGIAA